MPPPWHSDRKIKPVNLSGNEYKPDADIGRGLIFCAAGIVIFLAGFGLSTSVWVALLFFLIIGVLRTVSDPLYNAWLNQSIDEPGVRATIFSVSGQTDALGQGSAVVLSPAPHSGTGYDRGIGEAKTNDIEKQH